MTYKNSRRQMIALLAIGSVGCSPRPSFTDQTPRYREDFSNIFISNNGELLVVRGIAHDYIFTIPQPLLQALNSEFRSYIRAEYSIFLVNANNNVTGELRLYLKDDQKRLTEAEKANAMKKYNLATTEKGMWGPWIKMAGKRYSKPADDNRKAQLQAQSLNQTYQVIIGEVDHPNNPPPSPIKLTNVGIVILLGFAAILAAPIGGLCMNCK